MSSAEGIIDVLDTHTGGEPTRVVVAGGPDLGGGPLVERRRRFAESFDHLRRGIACEPRGSDVMVGALLVPPHEPDCDAGVIFFNNVGYLGMCGHGTIGVVVALAELGRLKPGPFRLDTPVGVVTCEYLGDGRVRLDNVPSRRTCTQVRVEVRSGDWVTGDVAWGGNWFFLCQDHGETLDFQSIERLTRRAWDIRHALVRQGITGDDGGEIDHIELFGPARTTGGNARNFVLCPGGAYDRSPCGTGTSAKIACLAADNKLQPGEIWRQESIIGSHFDATYQWRDGEIIPTLTGSAYISAESRLRFTQHDPFRWGIGS